MMACIKAKLLDFDQLIHHSVDDKSIDGWDDQLYYYLCVFILGTWTVYVHCLLQKSTRKHNLWVLKITCMHCGVDMELNFILYINFLQVGAVAVHTLCPNQWVSFFFFLQSASNWGHFLIIPDQPTLCCWVCILQWRACSSVCFLLISVSSHQKHPLKRGAWN